MKQWSAEERGGSGADEHGRVRCRDRYAYQRLRVFFSKQFMIGHWYVLERDRKPPMARLQRKACKASGVVKRNDFKEYPKEPWGGAGKHTTADMCRLCMSKAISDGRQRELAAEWRRKAAYEELSSEMWERKEGDHG